ncbi:GGDEF domain-containing protein [Alteromonas sp. A079]|uniref:GGDEF domain-containing protein n=1 Tax=Alteromonas sp. A079 TaxID=3410268 RepID=UPI003B9E22EF
MLFMHLPISFIVSLLLGFLALSTAVCANDDIDAVINKMQSPSYDCPNSELFPELQAILASDSLTAQQRFALNAAKGQFLICQGDYANALTLLKDIVAQNDIDKGSYAYASAIHQIGFVYDAQENPARCSYYSKAQKLSSPELHSDVFTSASLGLITYCSESMDVGERLGKMFSVLERYSDVGSPGELAHIHNSIGLLYGSLGQHSLAAEQYLKAHEMGLQVYEGSNKLSILISAIVSLLGSGQTDEAYKRIAEYGMLNQEIDTPLTNYLYQYSLSFYYRKTQDYDNLASTLPDLKQAVTAISSSFGMLIYKWHEAEVCLQQGDLVCVQRYLDSIENTDNFIPANFITNLDYLSFNLAMHLALGDIDKARVANQVFSKEAEKKRVRQQDSARVLSAANLYNKIYYLESEIEAAEQRRNNMLMVIAAIIIILTGAAAYVLRKKFLAAKAIDPVTQLLNAETAIGRMDKLAAPKAERAIAIAIFEISNLREITRRMGSTKADSVLRQIAQTLQNTTRGNDILGRFGTEQFILCLHNIEERSARAFFERVQTALDNTFDGHDELSDSGVESNMSIFIAHEKITSLNDILDEMVLSIGMSTQKR